MKTDWSDIEGARVSPNGYESKTGDKFGWFIWMRGKTQIRAMAVDGTDTGWEHVSVTVAYQSGKKWVTRTARWEEMVFIKSKFWNPGECVVEFHPPTKDYVNIHHNCLHLWKCVSELFPMPPTILV